MPAGSISPKAAGWKLGANSRAKITLCLPVLPLGQHLGQDMGLEELLTLASRTLLMLLPEESELPCLPYPAVWTFVTPWDPPRRAGMGSLPVPSVAVLCPFLQEQVHLCSVFRAIC